MSVESQSQGIDANSAQNTKPRNTSNDPAKKNGTKTARGCLVGCLTTFILFIILINWLMALHPVDYSLDNPESITDRRQLVAEVAGRLARMDEKYAEEGEKAWMIDPDRHWMFDRTRILLAIEEFIMENQALPDSMNDLVDSGLLDISKFVQGPVTSWNIQRDGRDWKLLRDTRLVLYGN